MIDNYEIVGHLGAELHYRRPTCRDNRGLSVVLRDQRATFAVHVVRDLADHME